MDHLFFNFIYIVIGKKEKKFTFNEKEKLLLMRIIV